MIDGMPKRRPPFLHRERNRHGNFIWYVRREHGPRIRLRAEYDTQAFWAEYRAALEGAPVQPKRPASQNSLRWLIDRYRYSSAWSGLSATTRRARENIFKQVIKTAGDEPFDRITRETIVAGRERRSATPHAANAFLKTMRGLFGWAAGDGQLSKVDPTVGVKALKGGNDAIGHHTWTEDEVALFEKRWPVGTRQRLAFDILLYTGFRRGDAVRLGRQHVRGGIITLRTEKTGETIVIPMLEPLAASIAATKTGDLTFIITEPGDAFTKAGFGNWFREAARKAGCPGTAHGLRKAGATRAAENGATDRQLMAMFGWTTAKQATVYTRAADKKRLAAEGAKTLLKQMPNRKRPHLRSGAGVSQKPPRKS